MVTAVTIHDDSAKNPSKSPMLNPQTMLDNGYSVRAITVPLPNGFHTSLPTLKQDIASGKPKTLNVNTTPSAYHKTLKAIPPNNFQTMFPIFFKTNRMIVVYIN